MMFRKTFSALALGAAVLLGACVDNTPGTDTQNTRELSNELMQKKPEAPGEFDITRAKDGEWYFNGVGARGQRLLLSEGYVERSSALNGILSVEENGVHLENYEVSQNTDGDWVFVLRAGNNQVIADSGLFRSQADAEAAVLEARDLVAGILQFKAAVTDGARFDLWKDTASGEWFFVMRAEDGNIILESEGYTGRTGAVNGLESVRLNGKNVDRYQIRDNGEISYILKAANGQEIAESADTFASAEEAQSAINQTSALLESERVAAPW
jgi:uncharacterized protein YegP (UPF0339 family)